MIHEGCLKEPRLDDRLLLELEYPSARGPSAFALVSIILLSGPC